MNEPTGFARTVRALEADSFRPATGALLLIAVVLAGWTGWMFTARFSIEGETLSPADLALRAAGVPNR